MHDNIVLLGSTGSIGTQTLDIVSRFNLNVVALSANSNISILEKQARKFNPKYVVVADERFYDELKFNLKDTNIKVLSGKDSLCMISSLDECDMVINAILGMAGLKPTIAAIESKKIIGLANKESLVAAGKLLIDSIKFENQLIPIDSEHSAIFQCLQGNDKKKVNKILLTASGGPFFGKTKLDLENVSLKDALNHPNWFMGKKISIDSATMMNKGLELIEAAVLFDIAPEDIQILIHRESIIHSMVEYNDGSIIAQLSLPDMKLPIQYALSYPDRVDNIINSVDFYKLKNLSFYEPDFNVFKSLDIALDAAKKGNVYPCALNAANEVAVEHFLCGKIKFTDIDKLVLEAFKCVRPVENMQIDDIFFIDDKVRNFVRKMV